MMGSSTTLAMNPSLYNKLSYDVNELAPIGLVGAAYFVLVANPSVPAKTLPELIAYIKSKPGELSFGTSGAGTPHHLFMEMFMSMTGTKDAARAVARAAFRRSRTCSPGKSR